MTDRESLKIGSFYWVRPVFDVDLVPPGFEGQEYSDKMYEAMWSHWSQREQPARWGGFDENGKELWTYLGIDSDKPDSVSDWPVCWIGEEIKL